jgi:ubiquinone/menaquinone biosynthesis C-methylase UbiE
MTEQTDRFVPALGADWLTPFYDVVARLTGERRFKRHLIEVAGIEAGHDVLDLGCGTGTLALMVRSMRPGARVAGMDIDPRILDIARRKIARAGADIALHQGSATAPPFPPASFDRILTTLMLHHLTSEQKRETLAAARRLLRRRGQLHIADFGKPHNALMRIASGVFRHFEGGESTGLNTRGELPDLVRDAGFDEVEETEHWMTPFGTLAFVRGRVQQEAG